MRSSSSFGNWLLSAVLALGTASTSFAAPPTRPVPPIATTATATAGLETAEALLEDLSFRNLELHDRAALAHRPTAAAKSSGHMTFTVDNGGADYAPFVPGNHPHGPVAGASDLDSYVRLLARFAPGPLVTGRFSDWRATSVYRSTAGLHNGYDIAYPAGTTIVAGWSGQVVSIANWYGPEYGITVQSPLGFRVTYGHLCPLARVGAWINPGDVVGKVVHDHVDVKMRSLAGGFIDFGRGLPGASTAGTLASGKSSGAHPGALPVASADALHGGRVSLTMTFHGGSAARSSSLPPLAGPAWTQRPEAVRAAIAYLRVRHQEASLAFEGATPAAISAVHRQIDEARGRLLETGVPEDVLLAAFADSQALRQGALWLGESLSSDALADVAADTEPRREETLRAVTEAIPHLRALLRDLRAQAPSS